MLDSDERLAGEYTFPLIAPVITFLRSKTD